MENEESNNYIEAYKELKNFREGKKFYEAKDAVKVEVFKGICNGVANFIVGSFAVLMCLSFTPTTLNVMEMILYLLNFSLCSIPIFVGEYLYEKDKNKEAFKKKYSDVDMDISDRKLNYIIYNTREYSFNNIKELNNLNSDKFNNMNYDSKVSDISKRIKNLKKLKEFYEAQQIKDNCNNKTKKLTK